MPIKRTITVGARKTRKRRAAAQPQEPAFKRTPNPKGKHLVVVESPAKARTIERILGKDYKVMASMGHLRDLPKHTLGVDIENGFKPEYVSSQDRADVIKNLQKEANKSSDVLLATDPDREGEAISWHLSKLLDVDPTQNVRIAFHEITPPAIKESIKHPMPVDMNRVDAQQARRVLDRIVGYKLSPWLWKQVYRGLSAGRVQSVAVRLVCEREEEIKAFKPEEYWFVNADYKTDKGEKFSAQLLDEKGKQARLSNKEEADRALADIKGKEAVVSQITRRKQQRRPKAPYTTSTMQQDAVNRLGFSSKKTMMLAQTLYEGVEIEGRGHVGLITYMRTDSTRISQEMIQQVRPYIASMYGEEYVPPKPNIYHKAKDAQDAHEAIRPTSLDYPPIALTSSLTRDQLKLYTLIWNRFMASQMAPQIQQNTSVILSCGNSKLRASGMHVLFDGFNILFKKDAKKAEEGENREKTLPLLSKGETVQPVKAEGEQHFTTPPPRFTEASLIKMLEEKGIGRPSTYAPILDTIQRRKYVEKEGKQFVPTEVGFIVTRLLKEYFGRIVDVGFTAGMEKWLDKVADGEATYGEVMNDFYKVFSSELSEAEANAAKAKKETQEVSDVICEKCGAHMIVKLGRYGKFLACPNYPKCRNIKPYGKNAEVEPSQTPCDKCGTMMNYKMGPYGRYLSCPSCGATKSIVEDTGITCPKCGKGHIVRRKSKRGRYFYGCSEYPNCDMVLWNEPVDKFCPVCGHIMVKRTYKNGTEKIFCSNQECSEYPARRTRKKKDDSAEEKKTEKKTSRRTKKSSGDDA
jgi:DNA topoisomerase-1